MGSESSEDSGGPALLVRRVFAVRGGVVVLDNVLWKGKVADPEHADKTTESIRQLNATLFHDERWTYSLLPIGDGVALCRKR